jgi:hypothetical protein
MLRDDVRALREQLRQLRSDHDAHIREHDARIREKHHKREMKKMIALGIFTGVVYAIYIVSWLSLLR